MNYVRNKNYSNNKIEPLGKKSICKHKYNEKYCKLHIMTGIKVIELSIEIRYHEIRLSI